MDNLTNSVDAREDDSAKRTVSSSPHRRMRETEELSTVARQFSVTLASSIVSAALGFALTLIVARGIGAEAAGVFFITLGVFAVTMGVLKLGADLGAMRMIARYLALGKPDAVRTVIFAGIVPVALLSVVAAVGVIVVAPELGPRIARNASSVDVASLLRAVIIFLPVATVSAVVIAATRGFGTMTPFIVTEQLGTPLLSTLAVGIVVALEPTALTLVGIAWAAPLFLGLVYGLFALRRLVDALPAQREDLLSGPIWREFWRFASVRGGASFALILVRWLDVILVGILASAREAGIYAVISRLLFVGTITQRAIIRVLGPRFSALLAIDDRARTQTLYQTSTGWLVALSFPFYLLVSVFASVAVLMFGPEFKPGATPLAIISIAMLVNIATGPATTILLMAGKASWNLANSYGSLVLNAGLNVVLIPSLGITGAAIAWAVSILFQNLVPTSQIFHAFRLHPFGPGALAAGTVALLVYGGGGAAIKVIAQPSPAATVLIALALTLIYLAVLWRFRDLLAIDSLRQSIRLRARDPVVAESR